MHDEIAALAINGKTVKIPEWQRHALHFVPVIRNGIISFPRLVGVELIAAFREYEHRLFDCATGFQRPQHAEGDVFVAVRLDAKVGYIDNRSRTAFLPELVGPGGLQIKQRHQRQKYERDFSHHGVITRWFTAH